MRAQWRKPRSEKVSASSAVLVNRHGVRGVQARFKGSGKGAGFGFAAEVDHVLIQKDLPLGFCQFFYQDLHC